MRAVSDPGWWRPCIDCGLAIRAERDSLRCVGCDAAKLEAGESRAAAAVEAEAEKRYAPLVAALDAVKDHMADTSLCESCEREVPRSTMVEADSIAGPIYFCPDCAPPASTARRTAADVFVDAHADMLDRLDRKGPTMTTTTTATTDAAVTATPVPVTEAERARLVALTVAGLTMQEPSWIMGQILVVGFIGLGHKSGPPATMVTARGDTVTLALDAMLAAAHSHLHTASAVVLAFAAVKS